MLQVKPADVVVAAGRVTRVVMINGEQADVAWVDSNGRIVRKLFPIRALKPLRDAMQPRSLWSESFEGDDETRTRAPSKQKSRIRAWRQS